MIFIVGFVIGMAFGFTVAAVFSAAREDDLANEKNRFQLELEQERWKSGKLG